MSFREKSAWISFFCLLAFGGFWLRNIIRVEVYHVRQANPMVAFFTLLGALILTEIVAHILIAVRDPKEARTPKDEREKLIDLKATRVAFYVLMAGAWLSIGTLHLNFDRLRIADSVLGAIILAQLVKFATQVALYRRDA
jgi:divalent metal cation (Fe/Co/Zn/Cd) transporter